MVGEPVPQQPGSTPTPREMRQQPPLPDTSASRPGYGVPAPTTTPLPGLGLELAAASEGSMSAIAALPPTEANLVMGGLQGVEDQFGEVLEGMDFFPHFTHEQLQRLIGSPQLSLDGAVGQLRGVLQGGVTQFKELGIRLQELVRENKPLAALVGATMGFYIIDALIQTAATGREFNPIAPLLYAFMQTTEAGAVHTVGFDQVQTFAEHAMRGDFSGLGDLTVNMLDALGEAAGKVGETALVFGGVAKLYERINARKDQRREEVAQGEGRMAVLPGWSTFLFTGDGKSDMLAPMLSDGRVRHTALVATDPQGIDQDRKRIAPRRRFLRVDDQSSWDRLAFVKNADNGINAPGIEGGRACLLVGEGFPLAGQDVDATCLGVESFLEGRRQLEARYKAAGKSETAVGVFFGTDTVDEDPLTGANILRSELIHEESSAIFIDTHGLIVRRVAEMIDVSTSAVRIVSNDARHTKRLATVAQTAGLTLNMPEPGQPRGELSANATVVIMQEPGQDPVSLERVRRTLGPNAARIIVVTRSEVDETVRKANEDITYISVGSLCTEAVTGIEDMVRQGRTIPDIRAAMGNRPPQIV